jgi:predicted Zn finger-like uncharacterized protein
MILDCPSCDARYFIEDAAIGSAGRTVRCAACGYSWFARPPLDLSVAEGAANRDQIERARRANRVEPHTQIRERDRKRRARSRLMAALGAWAGVAVVGAGLAGAAYIFRNDVVMAWPRAARAYAMTGIEVNPWGLDIGEVSTTRTFDGTVPILTVTGVVTNISRRERPAAMVELTLTDDRGEALLRWTAPLDRATIPAGGQAVFESRVDDPPLEALKLDVAFIAAQVSSPAPAAAGAADAHSPDPHGPDPHGPDFNGPEAHGPEAHSTDAQGADAPAVDGHSPDASAPATEADAHAPGSGH